MTGTITFNPPIKNGGKEPETTDISLTASSCATTGSSISGVTNGTATATIKNATNDCSSLLTPQPVAVAVAWSPNSVHASVVSFSSDGVITDATGHIGFGLPGKGGTATVAGSFAGSDGGTKSSASTYSTLTLLQLNAECEASSGLATLAIATGTVTLG